MPGVFLIRHSFNSNASDSVVKPYLYDDTLLERIAHCRDYMLELLLPRAKYAYRL